MSSDIGNDFYTYINREWLEQSEIPEGYRRWTVFSEQECRSNELISSILDSIDISVLDSDSDEAKIKYLHDSYLYEPSGESTGISIVRSIFSKIDAITELAGMFYFCGWGNRYGVQSFVQFDVDTDRNLRNILYILQSGLFLRAKTFYFSERFVSMRNSALPYMKALMEALNNPLTDTEIKRIWNVETRIASISISMSERRDLNDITTLLTWRKFKMTSNLPWDHFALGAELHLDDEAQLSSAHQEYFVSLASLLNTLDLAELRLWLKWKVASSYAPYISLPISEMHEKFIANVFLDRSQPPSREERAIHLVTSVMGEGLGKLYVRRRGSERDLAYARNMCLGLVRVWRSSLTRANWVANHEMVNRKLTSLNLLVGHPSSWRSYDSLKLIASGMLHNWQEGCKFAWDSAFSKLYEKVSPGEWSLFPHSTNATYHVLRNRVTIPLGIIDQPIFSSSYSFASNLGGLGVLVSHEIAHAFDERGRFIDTSSAASISLLDESFIEMIRVKIGAGLEASEISSRPDDLQNVTKLVNETFCDLLGFWVALRYLREHLLTQSMDNSFACAAYREFFQAWARLWRTLEHNAEDVSIKFNDRHAPPKVRCNFILSNCSEFYEVFNIQSSDKMWIPACDRIVDYLELSVNDTARLDK